MAISFQCGCLKTGQRTKTFRKIVLEKRQRQEQQNSQSQLINEETNKRPKALS